MYLDAHSNKFGFVPWDLDAAWGKFWLGTGESAFRVNRFEQEVGSKPSGSLSGERPGGTNRPEYSIKRFVEARAKSVRQQLDGKSQGIILKLPAQK
jgi:spore coat protein CotH